MNETAAERARRLRQIGGGTHWGTSQGVYEIIRWSEDELGVVLAPYGTGNWFHLNTDYCFEEPDVSLVKYNKGNFKF